MLAANLKGSRAEVVRQAMRDAAVVWQAYRASERRIAPSIDAIASKILGK